MDALIKSLRPSKPSDAKTPEIRPAELVPAEFLAAAVRADQPRPSRAEAEQAVQTLARGVFADIAEQRLYRLLRLGPRRSRLIGANGSRQEFGRVEFRRAGFRRFGVCRFVGADRFDQG